MDMGYLLHVRFMFKGRKACFCSQANCTCPMRRESSRLRGLPSVTQEHWVPAGPGVLPNAHEEPDHLLARAEDTRPEFRSVLPLASEIWRWWKVQRTGTKLQATEEARAACLSLEGPQDQAVAAPKPPPSRGNAARHMLAAAG